MVAHRVVNGRKPGMPVFGRPTIRAARRQLHRWSFGNRAPIQCSQLTTIRRGLLSAPEVRRFHRSKLSGVLARIEVRVAYLSGMPDRPQLNERWWRRLDCGHAYFLFHVEQKVAPCGRLRVGTGRRFAPQLAVQLGRPECRVCAAFRPFAGPQATVRICPNSDLRFDDNRQ
jgi:hypothetical protein